MKTNKLFRKTLLAASIAALTACGGGGSDSASTAGSTTVGVITGFGSIYVNGVRYETSSASIEIEDAAGLETELNVGDVVVIRGQVNADGLTGTASYVSSDDEVEGYVLDLSGLAPDGTGSINVMGQQVLVNMDTVFDDYTLASINDLSVNDIVEIHGFSDGMGNILATRVETKDVNDDVEIEGVVSNIDSIGMTFNIGDLIVDYSSATQLPSNLDDGLYVEVETESPLSGNLTDGFTMIASKIELEDDGDKDIDGDEGEDIKVQGLVTEVTATTFRFNGQLVEIASLEIDDDFDIADLVDGMMITVEGYINANGDFVVEEIEEDYGSELEAEGLVTAKTETTVIIDDNGSSMTFVINNDTRMMDERDENVTPLHYFSLSDVAIGDYVEIEYYVDDASTDNVATELEREDVPSS